MTPRTSSRICLSRRKAVWPGQPQDQLKEAELGLAEAEGRQQTAIARRGYLEGQIRRRQDLAKELNSVSSRKTELEEDQGIYQELVTAFGRQGVQAMLIETVIPRLEEEANYLLGQMTDNRMHLKLETQRERRSGRGPRREVGRHTDLVDHGSDIS